MIDFKLTSTGDLDLSIGDLQLIASKEAIAQLISTRLRFCQGEWFVDQRVGTPNFQQLLGAKGGRGLDSVKLIIAEVIQNTPGVTAITQLNVTLDVNRNLQVVWQVQAGDAGVVAGAENLIFGDTQ